MPATTSLTISLTRREAAELAGIPLNAVEKAVEQRVVGRSTAGRTAKALDETDVAVLVLLGSSPMPLPVKVKREIGRWVRDAVPHGGRRVELALSEALVMRWTPEATERMAAALRYVEGRERYIECNPEIKGGEPVLAGTRIGVRAIAQRLEHGESVESLAEDYPDIPATAFEVAQVYAKTHPARGRPVRPWAAA